jgi:hypothetical protein
VPEEQRVGEPALAQRGLERDDVGVDVEAQRARDASRNSVLRRSV